MRSRTTELSQLQLTVVMHIANGMTLREIASDLNLSMTYIQRNADTARDKVGARTLPQLVSMLIASGKLDWVSGRREVSAVHAALDTAGTTSA
jgi:FixJ family two-component response regulator